MKPQYRPEIDGLRSLAILPVVLYHSGLGPFSGGFVGVDVFFVISGYLISTIIINEIRNGTFTLAGFYKRRVRRIIPALLVVIFATLLGVLAFGLPSHVEDTGRSAIAAILSVSNIYFWTQSGYFAPAAEFMPLLHTWSLGVEEQFYFLFPISLLICHRLRIPIEKALALSLIPLFAVSVWLSFNKPSVAFYWLPARAWELGLGAVLATTSHFAASRLMNSVLSLFGLLLIGTAILMLDSGVAFPGYAALLPCLGAALIIQFAKHGTFAHGLLSTRPLVFIGLISYSLYLWHWPMLVFARMVSADVHLSTSTALATVALSVALSILTWQLVENPFRRPSTMPWSRVATSVSAGAIMVSAISMAVIVRDGFPARMTPRTAAFLAAGDDIDPLRSTCMKFEAGGRGAECQFGHGDRPTFALIGDSHAAAIRPALEHDHFTRERAGTLWWNAGCPLLLGARVLQRVGKEDCGRFRQRALEALRASPEITDVFLAGRWVTFVYGVPPETGGAYRTYLVDDESDDVSVEESERVFQRALKRTVGTLLSLGKNVWLVGAVPEPGFDVPQVLALAEHNGAHKVAQISRKDVAARNQFVDLVFDQIAETHAAVHYVPIWDAFCPSECVLIKDGIPIYHDDDHLTHRAALDFVGPVLAARLSGFRGATVPDGPSTGSIED